MASKPLISATFARAAAEYLREGETQRAIELCLAGTRAYPEYAMGHMVLGRCFEVYGRMHEALEAYRKALSKLPDNPTLIALVKNAEEHERKEFQRAVEAQEQRFEQPTEKSPQSHQTPEKELPQEESLIDFLAKRLHVVQRIKPEPASPASPIAPPPTPLEEQGTTIVTPTMAEIFANQGAYADALKAYRALAALHPDDPKFDARIRELEQLAAAQNPHKAKAPE